MSPDLDKKLVTRFPRLYRDRHKDMRSTALCWGFDVGDGWYDLLYELSEKLEEKIREYEKQNPNLRCASCGCARKKHYGCLTQSPKKCLAIKYDFNHWTYWFNVKNKVLRKLLRFKSISKLLKFLFADRVTCYCDKYDFPSCRAVQVKEKFGDLRFYVHYATEEMYDLIEEYEKRSTNTCEECGSEENVSQTDGWVYTRCDKCLQKLRDKKLTI